MRYFIFVYLIIGLLFTSCSYKQDQILFEQKQAVPDSILQKSYANIRNYRIQPQDILQIRNIQNDKSIVDLTAASAGSAVANGITIQVTNYPVEDDGTIALTGIGRVRVAGLTRGEATKYLEELYGKAYLKDPILEVKIVNLKVTILGEIKGQGNYILSKDKTTLVQLIGEAGGLTERANEKNIKIIRGDKKNPEVTEIDMSNIRSLSDPRTILQNDDIIYISQNRRAVRADKVQVFSTIIQPALIIFNTALIIYTLARR
jgi:polysaccharide export outer membrane protein